MHKPLLLIIILLAAVAPRAWAENEDRGTLTNTCDPYGFIIHKKRVQESLQPLNLSGKFLTSNKTSVSWNTSWSGKMNCTGTVDNVYFFSAIGDEPYYVLFDSPEHDAAYWVKFTLQITGPGKTRVRGIGVRKIANYRTDYTLTAELLSEAPANPGDRVKTVTNGIFNFPSVVMSGHGSADKGYGGVSGNKYTYAQEVWGYIQQETPASGWNTDHYLAFELVAVQFDPHRTTCDLEYDKQITLKPVTMDDLLQRGGRAGETPVSLPISCRNLTAGTQSTRNITAWLSSNDLVETGAIGYTMANDDSDAQGVGIGLRLPQGERVAIANGLGAAPGVTPLLNIRKDQDISRPPVINLVAYYQVYDSSILTTGSVIGTAQLMFNYD